MNNQLHNQIKQLSDRELLEGIYQMLLVVMQEQLISDSKQLGINVIADLLVDNMYRNRERNEIITMHHILGNKVLEYDVDDRGVIVDEREIDRTVNHKPNIADWVKEHMVFWYDMSKPVDTYSQNFNDWRPHPSVNADIIITSTSFVITRFATLNDTVKCYIPDQTKNFPGMKVEVKGIVDGQELYWGYSADVKLVNITSDGTYDIPPLKTVNGNLSFRNGNIVGACNITITQLPSGQSVPTNEILKTNPYLQDFSGNNRPLKLNNFLFAAMSGVGGYETNFSDNSIWISSPQRGNLINNHTYNPMLKGSSSGLYTATGSVKVKFKATVTGMKSGYRLEFGSGDVAVPYGFKLYADDYSNPNTDVIIELKEVYPNALVTDGVDDYGVVENFKSLQNYMMFFQCAIIRSATSKGMFSTTPIEGNIKGWMLLQGNSANEVRFGNNVYKNFNVTSNIGDKISYVLSANNELMTCYVGEEKATIAGTYKQTGANMSLFLSDNNNKTRFGSMAFYKSILFDSVPTQQTDGFTEQDLIDYVLENLITK